MTQNLEMFFYLFTLATFSAAGLSWRVFLCVVCNLAAVPAGGRCSS